MDEADASVSAIKAEPVEIEVEPDIVIKDELLENGEETGEETPADDNDEDKEEDEEYNNNVLPILQNMIPVIMPGCPPKTDGNQEDSWRWLYRYVSIVVDKTSKVMRILLVKEDKETQTPWVFIYPDEFPCSQCDQVFTDLHLYDSHTMTHGAAANTPLNTRTTRTKKEEDEEDDEEEEEGDDGDDDDDYDEGDGEDDDDDDDDEEEEEEEGAEKECDEEEVGTDTTDCSEDCMKKPARRKQNQENVKQTQSRGSQREPMITRSHRMREVNTRKQRTEKKDAEEILQSDSTSVRPKATNSHYTDEKSSSRGTSTSTIATLAAEKRVTRSHLAVQTITRRSITKTQASKSFEHSGIPQDTSERISNLKRRKIEVQVHKPVEDKEMVSKETPAEPRSKILVLKSASTTTQGRLVVKTHSTAKQNVPKMRFIPERRETRSQMRITRLTKTKQAERNLKSRYHLLPSSSSKLREKILLRRKQGERMKAVDKKFKIVKRMKSNTQRNQQPTKARLLRDKKTTAR